MLTAIQQVLSEAAASVDSRTSVFDIQLEGVRATRILLSGCVLTGSQLQSLTEKLNAAFPAYEVDATGINVLEQGPMPCQHVSTNLAGLYDQPSFKVPLVSELYYGTSLHILDENMQPCPVGAAGTVWFKTATPESVSPSSTKRRR